LFSVWTLKHYVKQLFFSKSAQVLSKAFLTIALGAFHFGQAAGIRAFILLHFGHAAITDSNFTLIALLSLIGSQDIETNDAFQIVDNAILLLL